MLSAVIFAADVTGKWTAEVKGRGGQTREVSMNLKADGEKLPEPWAARKATRTSPTVL